MGIAGDVDPGGTAETGAPILRIERGSSSVEGEDVGLHAHPEPKLLWVWTGAVLIGDARREWLVPPGYGVWIPGGVEHTGRVLSSGTGSALVFDPARCPVTWTVPTGVSGGELLPALITHLHQIGPEDPSRSHAEALLFDLITPLAAHDIHITMPRDSRVRVIADRLVTDPADPRDLAAWADHTHTSRRTLSRLFQNETGVNFAHWRTQVRIRSAIHLLVEGSSIDAVARRVGYRKTSAFIAAFRRTTGQTPGTYLSS